MGVNGRIDFPPNKVTVIYGANLQGKTNIINAIRYAFLKEIKKGRKKVYDEWTLPTRQEIISNGVAKIESIFEQQNMYYKLTREISAGGRKEVNTLFKLSGWPEGEETESIDVEPFIKERLKASLLDAVFAPEIAGGFKQLYGRDLDEAISEVFKEVVCARHLSQKFIERLKNMKSGAEAEMSRIEDSYSNYCDDLLKISKELLNIPEFKSFQTFEAGKTLEKTIKLLDTIRGRISMLEKEELYAYVDEILRKAQALSILQEKISQKEHVKQTFTEIKRIVSDKGVLRELLFSLRKILTIEDTLPKLPTFYDGEMNKIIEKTFRKVAEAKKLHSDAVEIAKKYHVKLETIKDTIKEIESVIAVLRKKEKIGKEKKATITKIGKKAFAVIPVKTLIKDPTFAILSDRPIPKGSRNEKDKYLKHLKQEFNDLSEALEKEKSAKRKFDDFRKKDIEKLVKLEEALEGKAETLRENIAKWVGEIVSQLSAFVGKSEKTPSIKKESDVDSLLDYVIKKIEAKKEVYLKNLNEKLSPLKIRVEEFNEKEAKKVKTIIEKEEKELPAYRKVASSLDSKKEELRKDDEVYVDYSYIPSIVEEATPVLNAIINESVDERKLKEAIATTYSEIIEKLKDRKLVEAIAEVSKSSLQAQVKYKNKIITHPAGTEKSFFSLAILSALGHYFRMPILMDEVANNLDVRNLPAFFNLTVELKSEKQLQYVLSIKETKDFDLDGWVKDLIDDIVIYELKGKNIQKKVII
jgi:hypothetical protein